jgi:hypothetical protein
MSQPIQPKRAAIAPSRHRYADRVEAIADGTHRFNVLIDGELRFRLEGDNQWPAEWKLYAVANGTRAEDCIAVESEYWDLLGALERGAHWMPTDNVERAARVTPRDATHTRFPEYLREH